MVSSIIREYYLVVLIWLQIGKIIKYSVTKIIVYSTECLILRYNGYNNINNHYYT